ncbi:peptidoglycan D,D-transpeptidase FtsI family protein [Paenibacillus mesotrionivorans]|uniref:Peptidoglycan D,D-transpeptidase FtsI family protein n=1 Tax=Paenibacillus mesotrionivorans TaxID=3160968 RepID=A0ACC7NU86_9BACL
MDKRRLFFILLGLVTAIAALAGRLLWLQTVQEVERASTPVDLVRQSVLQREQRLLLDSGRGDFYDRNGVSLTGETYSALLVFPVSLAAYVSQEEANAMGRVLGIEPEAWIRFRRELTVPRFWTGTAGNKPLPLSPGTAQTIRRLQPAAVAVVPFKQRYLPPYDAAQLIGYIGQNPERVKAEFMPMVEAGRLASDSLIGAAGLEKSFQPLLNGLGGTFLSLYTDSRNEPIADIGYRLHAPENAYYPLKVMTTLDAGLQNGLEQLADQAGLQNGAIVVLDAQTADIAGMVSRPRFDPDSVNPLDKGWANQALLEATPGSIFKTVIAAAALEAGVARPDERFECKGAWGKYHFTCWKKEGHGTLTFRQAYAQSCNIVFGQIMQRLTPEQVEEAARKLGVGGMVGWSGKLLQDTAFRQLDREDSGTVWTDEAARKDEGARLQTAIGQRDVRMTPLQAANMVVTLLNGGKLQTVRVVQEVRYQTDRKLADFPAKLLSGEDGISKGTSETLLKWMQDVVANGTGTALKGASWHLAGKSGTAQVPEAGADLYNQWFIGYGPVETPRYAVAVVSLKQKASGSEAVMLFRQVMEVLADYEKKERKK